MKNEIQHNNQELFLEITRLIEEARTAVSQAVNVGLTLMYWNIGKRINDEVLKQERAEYGKAIVSTLSRQLSWSHFVEIIWIYLLPYRRFRRALFKGTPWRNFWKK